MAILKVEIDTDELGVDYEGYGHSFEDVFHSEMMSEISKRVIANITKEEVGQYSMLVQEKVDSGVNDLFENLLSEDVVITDGYGSKKFVGSTEDYIKKAIDERYLYPVGNDGKKLNGCTSSSETWIQWYLKNKVEKLVNEAVEKSMRNIKYDIKDVMESRISTFINDTVTNTVDDKLKSVGIRLK